jgi:dimethylglycine dehydrogenase
MAKFMVEGEGAEGWLNHMLANRMPAKAGRMALSPMLSASGRLAGDFTVSRLGEHSFLLLGSDPMQFAYMRCFRDDPPPAGVSLRNVSGNLAGLHLAGPAARDVLSRLAETDLSPAAFPFLSARRMRVAGVADVIVLRVSYTGEQGFELYCAPAHQPVLFDALMREGQSLGLGLVGTRSLMMLRLEKSFPAWGLELTPDYTPFEAGLDRFVALAKPDFVGREAALAANERGAREVFCTFTVDADKADAWGDEAIWRNGEVVGYVTSGGYGAHTQASIALGYVRVEAAEPGPGFSVEILGEKRAAELRTQPLYDPAGERMRA